MTHTTDAQALALQEQGGELTPGTSPAGSMLQFIGMALQDERIDVGKLDALLRMQREVVADDARARFNAALLEAQREMPRVQKNGTIQLGERKGAIPFAQWEDVDSALRPIMQRHGFSLSFTSGPRPDGTGLIVTARLLHAAGHEQEYSMPLPADVGPGRNALQALGSSLSYGKRYLAEMIFNIVREGADDDGKLGGTAFITPAQKEEIIAKMAAVGADTRAFLDYLNVAVLDDLEARHFTAAMNALDVKARAKAKGAQA
jgi:hypothetical protein